MCNILIFWYTFCFTKRLVSKYFTYTISNERANGFVTYRRASLPSLPVPRSLSLSIGDEWYKIPSLERTDERTNGRPSSQYLEDEGGFQKEDPQG